jgi:hypothetical protein
LNNTQTNISPFKQAPSLIVLAGLLLVLLHPFQHVAETVLFEYDSVHDEFPFDKNDGTDESDCIECVLVTSMVTDFDTSIAIFINQSDTLTANQPNFLLKKHSEFGFSLRAPPVLYV